MDDKEIFIGGWTLPKLRERTQSERHQIWLRAKRLHTADGNHLARAIERLGLPYQEPERLAEGETYEKMREMVFSKEGRAAAKEATLDGLPAIAGLDSLFHDLLGEDFRRTPALLITAQALVHDLMTEMGYVESGVKQLPGRYVAREGIFWKRA